jgi:hypothetical protein
LSDLIFVFCFISMAATKQLSASTKPFFACSAELWKPQMVITRLTNDGAESAGKGLSGDSQMRTVSFMLALAFVLVGPSMAGSAEGSLPGIGTFAYNGSPIVTPAKLVVAVN